MKIKCARNLLILSGFRLETGMKMKMKWNKEPERKTKSGTNS